jgi:AbrB-like transcriptional regulator
MKSTSEIKPLTGKALLQRVNELQHLSRREKARECGYISIKKNAEIRVNSSEFLNAILEAKGVSLDLGNEKDGRGREASYRASVHKNGQILIGQAYTQKMGLRPGDKFELKTGYKHIHLVQINEDDEKK